MVKPEGRETVEKPKKSSVRRNAKDSAKKNGFEVRVVETKYGLRVLLKQGQNKIWLNERHLAMLFNALLDKVFGSGEGGE